MKSARLFFTLLLFALTPATAQAQNWEWPAAVAIAVSADTLSTYRNEKVCGAGERNPLFWTDGDWRRPHYAKMWAANAGQVGLVALLEYTAGKKRPGKMATALRWTARGLHGATIARRSAAVIRNVSRCKF